MQIPNLPTQSPFVRHVVYMEVEDTRNHVPALARLRNFLTNRNLGFVLSPKFVEWTGEFNPLSEVIPCQPAPGHPNKMTTYFVQCPKGSQDKVLAAIEEFGFKVMPWPGPVGAEVWTSGPGSPEKAHRVFGALAGCAVG